MQHKSALKPAQEFNLTPDSTSEIDIKPSQQFRFDEVEFEQQVEQLLPENDPFSMAENVTKPIKKRSKLTRLVILAVMAVVVVQTLLGLLSAWQQSPWLFGFYSAVLAVIGLWCAKICIKEYRQLKRLKQTEQLQQTAARLKLSVQQGETDLFIKQLSVNLPPQVTEPYFLHANDEQNDAEQLALYEQLVVTPQDMRAKKIVSRYAAESAILLAASPLAALDMALMLWRNQRMLRQIAACYGIELGYWSRIKLIKSIIHNIIYAGSSEIVVDLGSQLLSVEMTGKLSARLAQGLGGGLLTARLGYQAMTLCRPIAFADDNRPKLSQVHQSLLAELKDFSVSALSKNRARNKDFTKTE